ncbi:MAG: hypothetical protein V3W34_09785 [Phycisphaerae bacterium]
MATLQYEQHAYARLRDTLVEPVGVLDTSPPDDEPAFLYLHTLQDETVQGAAMISVSPGTVLQELEEAFDPLSEPLSTVWHFPVDDFIRKLRKELRGLIFMETPEEGVAHLPTEDQPIWESVAQIGAAVPPEEWANVPRDAAKHFKQILYGEPEGSE